MYPVWDVQWSPVGHYFATASHDRCVRVYAMDTPFSIRMFVGHLSNVDCVAWHPNANYVASGSADRTLRLWDLSDGECVRVFAGHAAGVRSIVFSPDGRTVASGADDGRVCIWDLTRATCVANLKGHVGPVYSMDYAGGGGLLVSGAPTTPSGSGTPPFPTPPTPRARSDQMAEAKPTTTAVGVIKRIPLETFPRTLFKVLSRPPLPPWARADEQ